MISSVKQVLLIDLEKGTYESKSFPDLHKFIGGVGVGIKLLDLYLENDPLIFAVGPLNGYFPYASKTSIVFLDNKNVEDIYIGGALSLRIQFAGYDAVVLLNRAKASVSLAINKDSVAFHNSQNSLNSAVLPGRSSQLGIVGRKLLLDGYFEPKEDLLYKKFHSKNLANIMFTGTKKYTVKDMTKYKAIYFRLLSRTKDMRVEKGINPSCSGCPMGCSQSKRGELGGNVLVHSLVACSFAEEIYSDIGTIFSCLNILGYSYTHEDIENLPYYIDQVLEGFNE